MWFTSFKVSEKGQAQPEPPRGRPAKKEAAVSREAPAQKPSRVVEIVIKGVALDSKTVADFMTRLENSPLFADINLKTLKQVTIKELNLMEFEVNLNRMLSERLEGRAL